ncbi:MAG: hypothetical protein NVSMB9_30700 [Isosphaeraceae bacterium]
MPWKQTLRLVPLLTVFALAAPAPPDDSQFKPLVEGTDASQFQLAGIGSETLAIHDGEIRVSGKPAGFFATKKDYKNYVLRFEWMYERPEGLKSDSEFSGNSGLLLHIQGDLKVWPRSIELQLMHKEVGKIYPIDGAKFDGKWDAESFKRAIKPVGQWNTEEVTCRDGSITCTLNGAVVTRGEGASPDHGFIGWQSEGVPIRFRNLKIRGLVTTF